ncbi:MAG: DUF2817 domain-containing protein [Planctomycetaceae bacterium]
MKRLSICVGLGLALAAGCATPQTYRQPPGTSAPVPDTTPSLGAPAQSFDSGSGLTPSPNGGPSLGMPEARRDDAPLKSTRAPRGKTAQPPSRTVQYRPAAAAPGPTETRRQADRPYWDKSHFSTERRPIETCVLGRGPRRVAVLGSLHGDEKRGAALVDTLAGELSRHPESLAQATVLLVKTPNPDGLATASPYNVKGVDLNRNFPTSNWRNLAAGRGGAEGASEVETRELVRLLSEFRPDLVVHLKDSRGEGLMNIEGAAADMAERAAKHLSCRTVSGLGSKTSGSLECYASTELHSPVLTLLLPRTDGAPARTNEVDALLVLLEAPRGSSTVSRQRPAQPTDDATLRQSSLKRKPAADPEFEERALAKRQPAKRAMSTELPAPVPDRGYVELPPP